MAAQFRRSDPQAIQDVRDSQHELWKTSPRDASFYEDVLALFDEQNEARTAHENITASLEIEGPIRESIKSAGRTEVLDQITAASDHASVAGGSSDPSLISDDNRAASTLLALSYSGPVQTYIQDTEPSNSIRLRSFNGQISTAPGCGDLLAKTGRLRSRIPACQKNLEKAVAETQQPGGHAGTPRRMRDAGADDTPARPGRSSTPGTAIPAQTVEEMTNEATLSEGRDGRQRPKKSQTPEILQTVSRPDSIVQSPAQTLPVHSQRKSRLAKQASLVSYGKELDDRSTAPSHSPRCLRSKVKIPPAPTTSVGTRTLRSSTKPLTGAINLSSASKDEIKSPDHSRGFDRFVDFSLPSTSVTDVDTLATHVIESSAKQPPAPRRSKRKVAIVASEDLASPTPKKLKLVEQSDTDSPTPIRRKGRQIPYEEHEDDEDVAAPLNNSPIKTKAKPTTKPQRKLVNAPAELPLKAPINTPGIPNDALAIREFFQKNSPSALGVQLPVNRTRTQWEWAPYVTRKAGNAQFDWTDEKHVRDANRWRQQRIRRRFAEHGIIDDGRKRR
jgi:hypothetical protein